MPTTFATQSEGKRTLTSRCSRHRSDSKLYERPLSGADLDQVVLIDRSASQFRAEQLHGETIRLIARCEYCCRGLLGPSAQSRCAIVRRPPPATADLWETR